MFVCYKLNKIKLSMGERLTMIPPEILPARFLRGVEIAERPVEYEKWFTPHSLVLSNTAQIPAEAIQNLAPAEVALMSKLASQISLELAQAYDGRGCPVILYDEGDLPDLWQRNGGYEAPSDPIHHGMIINPVFLGQLPRRVRSILRTLRALPPGTTEVARLSEDPSKRELLRNAVPLGLGSVLRRHLPEVDYEKKVTKKGEWPYIVSVGQPITEKMNMEPERHPNFTNMIFIRDDRGDIANLPYQWKQILGWMLMGKLGAFKSLIVPYGIRNGELDFDIIVSTLEGGHPLVSLDELPRRLMAFGSAREVGDWEELEDARIPQQLWAELAEIKGLMKLGRFCGDEKHRLLSPPIDIGWFVRSGKLAKLEKRLAGYSNQAEGAFMAFVPYLDKELREKLGLYWDGFHLCTISGRFGAVKTALQPYDFAAIGAFLGDAKVGVIPVNGKKPKGPSIEAYEFISPANELAQEMGEEFMIRLKKVPGGWKIDPNGEYEVPAIRGIFHFHRAVEIDSDRAFEIQLDMNDYPPVPCGSDLMHRMSKHMMQEGVRGWNDRGRKDFCAAMYVPNHGLHVPIFWTPNEDGIIPDDPAEQFEQLVKDGELVFRYQVPQK